MKMKVAVLITLVCLAAAYSLPEDMESEDEEEMDHDNFNEEVFGKDTLRELKSLSAEELVKEIEVLVQRMDADRDGRVSTSEMDLWLQKVQDNTFRKEGAHMFQKEDRNKDGVITFNEYWMNEQGDDAPIHEDDRDEEKNPAYAKFQTADLNKDGSLDLNEFVPFLHPFNHDHMIKHLIDDHLLMHDANKDRLISLDEFIGSFLPDEDKQGEELPEWVDDEKKDFKNRLDKNGDNVLDEDEIREWVAPSETAIRQEEVAHLFKHADLDKNGYLSAHEVRKELDIFINSPATDYGYTIHEEL